MHPSLLGLLCQAHTILLHTRRALNKQEVASLMVYQSGPSCFNPAEATAQECLRELCKRGLATRKGARYTGTWNGLPVLPAGQVYAWRPMFAIGNGDRQGPIQPTTEEGFKADSIWLAWFLARASQAA